MARPQGPAQIYFMKILQLCKKFPYPLKDGESIAVTSLSRAFHELGSEVTLLAMNTHKHYFPIDQLPAPFSYYKQVQAVPVDNRVKPWEALKHLFKPGSYHISRFVSQAFSDRLAQLLRAHQFDVIQLETPYLSPYLPLIRQYSSALVSMRAHNVEHEIWGRIVQHTRPGLKRCYLSHLTGRLRAYEVAQLQGYDYLAAITERDLQQFRQLGYEGAGSAVPIGIDCSRYHPDYGSYQRPVSFSFIGSLDWMPNQEGLKWFLDSVWGALRQAHPTAELHVAGRNTPDWLTRLRRPGVKVHGEVPSASQFINRHSVMVVPLLAGSGMRAKILEGMALGKAVLTTPVGLEGIAAKDQQEVLIAEGPEGFLRQAQYIFGAGPRLEQMGQAARRLVQERYDSREVARGLLKAYRALNVEAL